MANGPLGATDLSRWRLDSTDHGRHVWSYERGANDSPSLGAPNPLVLSQAPRDYQTFEEKYWLGLETDAPTLTDPAGDPLQAAKNGFEFFKSMQSADGHWAAEYGGPLFLIPGMIVTLYVTKTPIPEEWKIEITRYIANYQRQGGVEDHGWGLHTEGPSTVFGTAMNYVALRLLGVDSDHPMMIKARATLHALGGASAAPSWAKAWLCILNVYSWDGMNAIPPELWMLPEWVPIHPWRWWTHTRRVYIPMGYLYAKKFQHPLDDLTRSIRAEIYPEPYESIYWPSCRNKVAQSDLYSPHTKLLDTLYLVLGAWEKYACPAFVRRKGMEFAYKQVVMDDENTNCQTIGPVSKAMNMLCRWVEEGPDSEGFKGHLETVRDFFWLGPKGMMMCGTNGSQLWDAAFAAQAVYETGLAELPENRSSVTKLLEWLDDCQMQDEVPHLESGYRHRSKGAWPFSTREQHYTVSDCTSEALKGVIYLQSLSSMPKPVSRQRMYDAVDVILSLQNPNGGFASYELIRGTSYMELINPAEVFGNIMIEYNYPECTTACLTALSVFRKLHPEYRRTDIEKTIRGALAYIHASQRPDGLWFGSWGVCFTYATMFALESLALNGESYATSSRVRKACDFLLTKQMQDGGWGESWEACARVEWVDHEMSQVINTAWAVIALLVAKCPDHEAIRRGCQLIMSRQLSTGEWKYEATCGIFNRSCAIDYKCFQFIWPIWALGKAARELPDPALSQQ